jgi:hypothetical protein
MIKEKLGAKDALRAAKKALSDDGWGYSDLRKVSDAEWKGMNIPGGIRTKILKHWKIWGRIEKVHTDAFEFSDSPSEIDID